MVQRWHMRRKHARCQAGWSCSSRNLATTYPYDTHEESKVSLRLSAGGEVADRMRHEIQDRLSKAGIEVIEARISHLAYAPEIAGAMLRRQQASAVIAARQLIVEGAVGMVEMALNELSRKNVVSLDEERKAAMVSNRSSCCEVKRGSSPSSTQGPCTSSVRLQPDHGAAEGREIPWGWGSTTS